jgi:hypothetical protein
MPLRSTIVTVAAVIVVFAGAIAAQADVVQEQGFEHETWDETPDQELVEAIEALRAAHTYPGQESSYLVDVRSLDLTRTRRSDGYLGRGLQVTIPVDGYRGFGPYARLPQPVDEAWYAYYVYLADFRPASSGKLPGLADASLEPSAKGCIPSTPESPGWSGRLMFDAVGTAGAAANEVPIGLYLYHLGQAGDCGDEMMFGVGLEQRRWTCIEGHVRMNTPGQSDGLVQAWVDGRQVLAQGGLAFRRPGESVAIREMWNNVYFGGRYPTPNRLQVVLDQMVVSDSGRVGCVDPFLDDDGTVHEGDLTELYARRLLLGCGERLACPLERLTRAEFAAVLHRLIRLPAGPDAFSDDEGHWAEGVLNSLAAAGIVRGCDPPANTRACPDGEITRAEVGVMVRRTLGLPPGADAFSDDDGHWAEADIDALAAAGITRGCGQAAYCPDRLMLRMEAGTFVLRADDILRSLTVLAPAPEWPPPGPPPEVPAQEREWLSPPDGS